MGGISKCDEMGSRDNNKDYKWIASFPSDTPNQKRHNIFGLWSIDLIDQLEKDLENGSKSRKMGQ